MHFCTSVIVQKVNYKENMFIFEDINCSLKPMNCPMHALMFQEENITYKDLPYKIAEFGSCFRNEKVGGLSGLKRARKLTIEDGHIFCKIEHIKSEIEKFLENADAIYNMFGFKEFEIYIPQSQ